jgi:hypothetical protein
MVKQVAIKTPQCDRFKMNRYKAPVKALSGEPYSVLGTKKGGRRVAVPAVVPDDVKELKCTVDMNKRTLLYRWEKVK